MVASATLTVRGFVIARFENNADNTAGFSGTLPRS
jgi:hypothetical protein